MYTVFFGLDILCLAYLVLQSKFVPRAIGVLLAIDGVAYLVYSFADLLAPGFAAHLVPWIQLPGPIAEGAFSLWLLVFGVNTKWWTTRAGAAAYSASVKQPNKLVIENGRFGAWEAHIPRRTWVVASGRR